MTDISAIDISFVLDRSGSMNSVRKQTIAGFNQFLREQQQVPGTAHLTLVQFDHEYELLHRAVPLAEICPLNEKSFVPRGGTALLDAIGRTILDTGQRLTQMPEPQRPGQVLFVILTDGFENSSKEFDQSRIFQMIQHQQEVYGWQFVFLGADQDAIATATRYGIDAGSAMSYSGTGEGTSEAMSSLSEATLRYRHRRRARSDSYFDKPDSKNTGRS